MRRPRRQPRDRRRVQGARQGRTERERRAVTAAPVHMAVPRDHMQHNDPAVITAISVQPDVFAKQEPDEHAVSSGGLFSSATMRQAESPRTDRSVWRAS